MSWTKLSDLVNQEITITSVGRFSFKKWENGQMLTSPNYQQGYRKVYQVETDKGTLDISANNIGQMLESVSFEGSSDITGKTFSIKSNGKTGMEIRYFINPVR